MKTNNIASYTDVLVTCMRQNPKWILLSEVRSAEAVMAVRNSISSGHNILSTIHADKASSIPLRMYSLLETSQEVDQFLTTIHRYVQIGVYVKGYFSKRLNRFQREIIEVCEFYVDDDNKPCTNMIYKKSLDGHFTLHNPTQRLIDYMSIQNVILPEDVFGLGESGEEKGDESTDMSTKDPSLMYDEENRPKPTETKFSIGQVSYNEGADDDKRANAETFQNAMAAAKPAIGPNANKVFDNNQNQVNNAQEEESDEGSEDATLKPNFTNPEEVKPNIEVL